MARSDKIIGVEDAYFHYDFPLIICKNPRNTFNPSLHDPEKMCRNIPLPFPILPLEDENQFDWPPDGWSRTIACIDCARVYVYEGDEVAWAVMQKQSKGQFRADTNCFFVEAKCARKDCDIPVKFHIEMFDSTQAALEKTLQKGFVGQWPQCRHDALVFRGIANKVDRVYLGPI